ncbi:DUF4239 domain-containing protein [bacterium]|nr:DUF4239 domain-containing protein [bacterium]
MTFGRYLLLHVPPVPLGILTVGVSVAAALGALLLVRRFISHERLRLHNDVAGFLFGTIGVIYAVLLAFTVIVVWENYDEATANVDKEASCIANIFRNVEQLNEPFRSDALALMREYVAATVTYDWETTGRGQISPRMFELQGRVWKLFGGYTGRTQPEEVFFELAVEKFNDLCDARRMRLLASRAGVDTILWCVLIFGGMITVVFTFFFGIASLKSQIVMTSLLTALISLILFTVLAFDYPFTGRLGIPPEPIRNNLRFFGYPSSQEVQP